MTQPAGSHELVVTRRLSAPPEDVFDAWLDAGMMSRWMCPGDVQRADVTIDPRVGGTFSIDMVGPTATHPHRGEYLVLDRPRQLSFTWTSNATKQKSSVVTIDLSPAPDGTTELVLRHRGLPDEQSAGNHQMGWASIVEKLDSVLVRR